MGVVLGLVVGVVGVGLEFVVGMVVVGVVGV